MLKSLNFCLQLSIVTILLGGCTATEKAGSGNPWEIDITDSTQQINRTSVNPENRVSLDLSGTLSLDTSSRSIDQRLMCFNTNPLMIQSWQDPVVEDAINQVNPKILRIPGGTLGDYWDWKKGGLISNIDQRLEMPWFLNDQSLLQRRNSTLGDYKSILEATNSVPMFTLNMLTSSLESQLEMLKTARNMGIEVKYVELGNEYYAERQNYIATFKEPEDYAHTANQWIAAIKQEFPEVKVAVIGVDPGFIKRRNHPRSLNWNSTLLEITQDSADIVTLHVYHGSGLVNPLRIPQRSYPFFTADDIPKVLGRLFDGWEKLKNDPEFISMSSDKEIWITEYNLFEQASDVKISGSWLHGLYSITMSLLFLESQDISILCNHVLIGNSQFGAIFPDDEVINRPVFINPSEVTVVRPFSLSATGSALKLFSSAVDEMRWAKRINFPTNSNISTSNSDRYPSLYGWGFTNGQRHQALIVNLSDNSISIDLENLFSEPFEFEQISGDPRLLVTNSDLLTKNEGEAMTSLVLPAYSVTKLKSSGPS